MVRRPALLMRLPSLRWRSTTDEEIVPHEVQSEYPALAMDFTLLEHELLPDFRTLDNDALQTQNQFRLLELIVIVGGILATTLGAIQTARVHDVWPGIVEAVLSALLAGVAVIVRELEPQVKYFTKRLQAELLRSEYFLFLGRITPYADDPDRLQPLKRRVAGIVIGKETP